MTVEVKSGNGYATGNSLTTKGNATAETTNEEYEADAERIINFLHTLPGGTIDRVFKELKKHCS